ncbi:Pentatricopeptide repeat-containing protein [Platanthera zijinensis]|uniref:Pentatricopeptide repeat-containing protein n=1 Tax=Platanthera zijinensis TaxID=2320716 RepID=A0AAP0AUL4_9ASPA
MESYFAEDWEEGAGHAHLLFRQVPEEVKDTFLWSVMLRFSSPEDSLRLFSVQMLKMRRSTPPDGKIYTHILQSCVRLRAIREGRQVQAQALKDGLITRLALATTCVHLYAVCREIDSARQLFDEMPERSSVSWNAMLSGYCVNGFAEEALLLFKEMVRSEMRTTKRTSLMLLSACSQIGDLALGSAIHSLVLKTIPNPLGCPFTGTALVDMYSKCGSLGSASSLFHAMSGKNVITWSTMVAALAIHGQGKAVMELMNSMEKEGILPNAVTFTSLLSACGRAGLVEEGLRLFDEMQGRFNVSPTKQHYGCVVDLLARSGMVEEAHQFIKNMPVKPDAVAWRALLSACRMHGEAQLGGVIGKILIGLKQPPEETFSLADSEDFVALSNVYAFSERWEDVQSVRTTMKKNGLRNKAGHSSVHNIYT